MRTRKRRGNQNNKVLIISAQHYGPGSAAIHNIVLAASSTAQAKLQNNIKKMFFKVFCCLMRFAFFIYYIIIFCNFSLCFSWIKLEIGSANATSLGQLNLLASWLALSMAAYWAPRHGIVHTHTHTHVCYVSVRYTSVINYFASYKCIYSRVDAWDRVVGEGWQTKYQSHCGLTLYIHRYIWYL